MRNYNHKEFSDLLGKTLTEVTINDDFDEMIFKTSDGDTYRLYSKRVCCVGAYVESVFGELQYLVGTPILLAEEVIGETTQPVGWTPNACTYESFAWTSYKLATINDHVTIRWVSGSNKWYSKRVNFTKDSSDLTPRPDVMLKQIDTLQTQIHTVSTERDVLKSQVKSVNKLRADATYWLESRVTE